MNYRGSNGRGSAYQKAIFADWGNKEVVDLLGGDGPRRRSSASSIPIASGIGGWSYGGILTELHDRDRRRASRRRSAAPAARTRSRCTAPTSTSRSTSTSSGRRGRTQDLWIKISYPFFHADRIKTPTLFLGGEKDFNVPLLGSEQMYQALRSLGRGHASS